MSRIVRLGIVGLLMGLLVDAGLGAGSLAAAQAQSEPKQTDGDSSRPVKRLLLIGQGPDGHPATTHEFMAGIAILAKCLQRVEGLQTIITKADNPWTEGPELLDGCDAAVVFVSEGAKWIQDNPERLAAFERLKERGGGLVSVHWAMGCRDARFIPAQLALFGGCHGGPDRKHKIVEVRTEIAAGDHPVLRGIEPFDVEDEFYYRLKFVEAADSITPLLRIPIDGESHTVAWAWERPDGGRSFGFSGCHFHRNWKLEEYRRLVTQAAVWACGLTVPANGLPVDVAEEDFELKPQG